MAKKKAKGTNKGPGKQTGQQSIVTNEETSATPIDSSDSRYLEGQDELDSLGQSGSDQIVQAQELDVKSAREKSQKTSQRQDKGFNVLSFFKGTKDELDKVVWPTRQELISESVAVLLMVTLSATTIYLVDNFFNWAARQVFG